MDKEISCWNSISVCDWLKHQGETCRSSALTSPADAPEPTRHCPGEQLGEAGRCPAGRKSSQSGREPKVQIFNIGHRKSRETTYSYKALDGCISDCTYVALSWSLKEPVLKSRKTEKSVFLVRRIWELTSYAAQWSAWCHVLSLGISLGGKMNAAPDS